MNPRVPLFILAGILATGDGMAAPSASDLRCRNFVLTHISNEPDDEESLVRFLVYANEYDIEGLIATTSTHLRNRSREDLIRRQLDAYGQVHDQLVKRAPGYPTQEQLPAVTATGQPAYGMPSLLAYRRAIVEIKP